MTPFEKTTEIIQQLPTTVYGLKYFPSIEPVSSNDKDDCIFGWPPDSLGLGVKEISIDNFSTVVDIVKKLGARCNTIVEIGVNRNDIHSITQAFLGNKSKDCVYIGIDLDDKSYLNNSENNVFTIKENSHNHDYIRNAIKNIGRSSIDILMIDGWHSVNTCVNDWKYVDLLSDHGVVLMHDTNCHPGTIALYNAIDESMFDKSRVCLSDNDMGMAIIWKKK